MVTASNVLPLLTLTHSPDSPESPSNLLRFKISSTSTHKRIWVSRRNMVFLHREETFLNGPVIESKNPEYSRIFKPQICYMLSWSHSMDIETKTKIADQIHRRIRQYLIEMGLKEGLITMDLEIKSVYFVDDKDSTLDPNIRAMIEKQKTDETNNISNAMVPANWLSMLALQNVKKVDEDRFCNWTCNVCLEGFNGLGLISQMPCLHEFHEHCIISWLKKSRSCPICRNELDQELRSAH